MKRLIFATALLSGGMLPFSPSIHAHGGTYRGPGDTVPPAGGGASGGGPGPVGPGPTSPGDGPAPGRSGYGPQRPGQIPGHGDPTTGGSVTLTDLTSWKFWWEFNKNSYLNLKSRIHSGAVITGSTEHFLGQGEVRTMDTLKPTEHQIQQVVVPALLQVLESETNNDIVTGALIALAKIGDVRGEDGSSELERVIASFLGDSNLEISETAAVSLGILANGSSIETLEALLMDQPEARKQLVKRSEVPHRTRSFAAFGLGLIAARSSEELQRQRVVDILVRAIETDDTASRDLKVACIISLGLAPLTEIDPQQAASEPPAPSGSRAGQIQYLFDYLNDEENEYLVRAHCPTALARLVPADALHPTLTQWRGRLISDFKQRCSRGAKERNEVVQSAVIGLGLLGDNGTDGLGAQARRALLKIPESIKDQQSRNFSMIAAAQAGGQPGAEASGSGVAEVSEHLASHLRRGKSAIQPWAGLAIGVLSEKLADQGAGYLQTQEAAKLLRLRLAEETNTDRIGAFAIAAGIMRDEDSTPILMDYLAKLNESEARGYVCVSLALMGATEATDPLREIVSESEYKPQLLKQAAVALGYLGDKEVVPMLTELLASSSGIASQAALASALGSIGDRRSIEPLVEMLLDEEQNKASRGFAAVALGIVADKETLPWNTKIAEDLNYRASTETLVDSVSGTGILDIL